MAQENKTNSPDNFDSELPTGPVPGADRSASKLQILLLGTGLIALALLLAYLLFGLWPSEFKSETNGSEKQKILWLGTNTPWFETTADVRLLMVVMLAGGLGSFIHTATSFGDFVGNQKLSTNWLWWYILKPFIGMTLALIFYLVVRGGFLSASADVGKLNLYGIVAIAGLVGMFTKQATDKLSEVFNTMFRTIPGGGDSQREGDLGNPVPTLTGLEPNAIERAAESLLVTVKGSHFVKGSVVRINGVVRQTEFKDESEIIVKLVPEDVANEGQLEVVVVNPSPGGGKSMPMKIDVLPIGTRALQAAEGAVSKDDHVDGCDVAVLLATPDEALPPALGGVDQK